MAEVLAGGRAIRILVAIAPALLGAILLTNAANGIIGATPDSASYLGGAEAITNGQGYVAPVSELGAPRPEIAHYPPGYSYVLAGLATVSGGTVDDVALSLHIFLFAVNTMLLVTLLVWRAAVSPMIALLGGLLFVTSQVVFELHAVALSEPLFLLWLFIFLHVATVTVGRWSVRWTVTLAAPLTGAVLTRYVGVSLVLAALILLSMEVRRLRLGALALRAVVLLAPVGLLVVWMLSRPQTLGNRSISAAVPSLTPVIQLIDGVIIALFPKLVTDRLTVGLAVAIAAVLVALVAHVVGPLATGTKLSGSRSFVLVSYATAAAYLVTLVAYETLIARRAIHPRLVVPLGVVLIMLLAVAVSTARARDRVPLHLAGASLLIVLATTGLIGTHDFTQRSAEHGIGLRARHLQSSEIARLAATIPAHCEIVSNYPEVVYLNLGRTASALPREHIRRTFTPNPSVSQEVRALRYALEGDHAVLLDFDELERWYQVGAKDVLEATSGIEIRVMSDGLIAFSASPGAQCAPETSDSTTSPGAP